jgi:hypothetical protein
MLTKIISDFYSKARSVDFSVKGLLLNDNRVLTLGSDSKLIGRIFELVSSEILKEICLENGWELKESVSQTVYPDYTFILPGNSKIAVDIKSTYRRYNKNGYAKYGFTLGSYASFLRNNTKNIAYPYNQYIGHLVIGFVYDRVDNAIAGEIKNQNENIMIPYNNLQYFIQEKYKIAGDRPGSGNTENIGSILTTNITDFIEGKGTFTKYGSLVFEDYWKNYPKYRAQIKKYTCFSEYQEYIKKQTAK